MSNLITIIKQAAIDAVNSSNPIEVSTGVLTVKNPVEITLTPKITLKKDDMLITDKAAEILKDEETEPGINFALLSLQGGQKYLLLDKVE